MNRIVLCRLLLHYDNYQEDTDDGRDSQPVTHRQLGCEIPGERIRKRIEGMVGHSESDSPTNLKVTA